MRTFVASAIPRGRFPSNSPVAPPDLEERVPDLVDETIAESNRRMETDPADLRAARIRAGIPPEGYGGTLRD